ncbi:hypothetical protein GCM10010234_75800 [Streptomyces hawaiiensis]
MRTSWNVRATSPRATRRPSGLRPALTFADWARDNAPAFGGDRTGGVATSSTGRPMRHRRRPPGALVNYRRCLAHPRFCEHEQPSPENPDTVRIRAYDLRSHAQEALFRAHR